MKHIRIPPSVKSRNPLVLRTPQLIEEHGRSEQRNTITRGVIFSGPDSMGWFRYLLHWMADYHPGDPAGEYRRAERREA